MKIGNYPLLWAVLEYVIDHPDEYNQEEWRNKRVCGTVRCIAGWAANLAGYKDVWSRSFEHLLVLSPASEVLSVEKAALAALDVSGRDADGVADELFSGVRTFDDVLGAVRDYAYADGAVPTRKVATEMFRRGVISEQEYNAWI